MSTATQESIDKAVYRLTEWGYPNSTLRAYDGMVRYDHWLQGEVERLKDKWTESWVEVGEDGRIALFKWNNEIKPVEGEDEK